MKLETKVALVTGAGGGIGKVIAQHLAAEGATVVINYLRSEKGARDTAEAIVKARGRAIIHKADVSDVAQGRAMIERTVGHFGRLDILVNNSGVDPSAPFLEVTEELFCKVIDTNLKGTFFCSQFAAQEMRKRGQGRIINIGSVHGRATMPGFSAYAASKGAIEALTRQLSLDLGPFNITVNVVAPGAVEVEKFVADPAYDPQMVGKEIPMGRVGYPRDISGAVVFLASEDAAWITGQVITIDGGTMARLYLYAGRPMPTGHKAQSTGH
jgi:NAD(P)-dependent dehydrogenase (short-subunit alcohol dehydrogenase family)